MSKLLFTSPEDRFEDFVWSEHRCKRIFETTGKAVQTLGKEVRQCCRNSFLCALSNIFAKKSKSSWLFSDLAQKLIQLLLKKFGRVVKTASYACRKTIWGKYFLNLLLFQTLSQIFATLFQTFGRKLLLGCWNCFLRLRRNILRETFFCRTKIILGLILARAQKLSRLWANNFDRVVDTTFYVSWATFPG